MVRHNNKVQKMYHIYLCKIVCNSTIAFLINQFCYFLLLCSIFFFQLFFLSNNVIVNINFNFFTINNIKYWLLFVSLLSIKQFNCKKNEQNPVNLLIKFFCVATLLTSTSSYLTALNEKQNYDCFYFAHKYINTYLFEPSLWYIHT